MLAVSTGGPSFEVGGWVAWIVIAGTVVAAALIIVRSPLARPVRWLFRQVVGAPVTRFMQLTVGDIVEGHVAPLRAELTPNHGSSLVDKVDLLVRSADNTNERIVRVETEMNEHGVILAGRQDVFDQIRNEIKDSNDHLKEHADLDLTVAAALADKVKDFEEYSHNRWHQLANTLQASSLNGQTAVQLAEAVDRLTRRLDDAS